jgi:eukaryotic-like serine/threonine-protein kinase
MLPGHDAAPALQRQLREACAELERCLRAGQPCAAEDLLAASPALGAHTEAALELIYTEFVLREELGQRPAAAELIGRFPQWRADLEQLFQVHQVVGIDSPSSPARAITQPVSDKTPRPLPADAGRGFACRLGRYELLEELGRGGMGVVCKARQVELDRIVALKMIRADDHAGAEEVARFRREAEAVARLQHPNIV